MKIGGPFYDKSRRKSPRKWWLSYFVPKVDATGAPVLTNGKTILVRKRPYYRTKDDAQADKPRILAQYGAAGASQGDGGGVLTREQVSDYETARSVVPEVPMADMARFYRKHHPVGEVKSLGALRTAFLNEAELRVGKGKHLTDLTSRTKGFVEAFNGRAVESITRKEVIDYLLGVSTVGRTVRNHKAGLANLFNWLVDAGHLGASPIARLPRRALPRSVRREIEFFTLDQVRTYLEVCERYEPSLVAHEVIQLFAGVRADDEMADFDGKWVLPQTQEVVIPSEVAKTGRREVITGLEDNFWAWWSTYGRKGGLRPGNYRKKWWRVRALAGIDDVAKRAEAAALPIDAAPGVRRDRGRKDKLPPWPWNARRRTFCTYHVAKHQSADKTALILRHRGEATTLHNSYRGTGVTQSQGTAYFEILPLRLPDGG